jgi:hypothetical protein
MMRVLAASARNPRWPGYDQATSGPTPPEVITPGGAPPGRPANIRSAQALQDGAVCLQPNGLLDAMRMIVPAVNGIRATEAPWYLGWPIRPRAREDRAG